MTALAAVLFTFKDGSLNITGWGFIAFVCLVSGLIAVKRGEW